MSHFLRQLHVMSSLKTGSETDKFLPVYKALAPILTVQLGHKSLHTHVVDKNIMLKTEQKFADEESKLKPKNGLAIILSWLLAKGSHIDKYCNLYLQRGFDVLTVQLTPQEMLFPSSGSQVVATNILDYLNNHKEYDKVLVHAFSVGAYLMGEVLVKVKEGGNKYADVPDRIIGMILDSAVDIEGIPTGFPKAVAKNPLTVKVLEWYVKSHLALFNNVSTKHYRKASKQFHNTQLRCPALFLVSEGDAVGTPAQNEALANDWSSKGIDVYMKCWQKSKHVSHMHYYKDEYVNEIDKFLAKLPSNM